MKRDEIEVDGKLRSRRGANGQSLGADDATIADFWRRFGDSCAVDEAGRPIPFFHGTAAQFEQFSPDSHRTVLNEKYQGDAFHFSPDMAVARKYAFAARNEVFNRSKVYAALDRSVPAKLANVFKSVVERGYSATWDMPEDQVKAILDCATNADIDINDLLDLAEFVEGSNYNLGRVDGFDAGMIFGSSSRGFPDWARESAKQFGLAEAAPSPRIVLAYLKCEKLLRTNSREQARDACKNGYDSVLFEGDDLVSGTPEWAVYTPEQIFLIGSVEGLHLDNQTWRPAARPIPRGELTLRLASSPRGDFAATSTESTETSSTTVTEDARRYDAAQHAVAMLTRQAHDSKPRRVAP
jgi:hypothetical protein